MAGTDILENNFKKLDDIVSAMEKGDLSLEEAFKLYKEGLDLVAKCNESIDRVEKEIKIIDDDAVESDTIPAQ